MQNKRTTQFRHTGKSLHEKEAYKNFVVSDSDLGNTESEPVDINKTNESSFKEEIIPSTKKSKRKSKRLRIKDSFNNNPAFTIIISIITAIMILALTLIISMNREQGVQGEKISKIENNIENLNTDIKNFNIFKIEVTKDLEFIKKGLKF